MKIGGFYASRKRDLRPSFLSQYWRIALALLTVLLLWILGLTHAWSQSWGPSSMSSSDTLTAWNKLYSEGWSIYEQQKEYLAALETEISILKTGSGELTTLSGQLSASNESLRRYNGQIAERMQERDEDLAAAYGDIERLEKSNLKKNIALVGMGAIIAALTVCLLLLLRR